MSTEPCSRVLLGRCLPTAAFSAFAAGRSLRSVAAAGRLRLQPVPLFTCTARFPRGRRHPPASPAKHSRAPAPAATAGSSSGGEACGPPYLPSMDLSAQDRAMIRLYMAGCFHYWDQLPELAKEWVELGASLDQLRGCVRHLVVFAGYGPCLAATLALHKAKLLPEDTPAKAGGPPGNAFELVYGGVTDRVRANMHAADPVLGEWIRMHLYGDVYSSPGLDMRRKQLLTCAFLAEANMPDQLFGHALAGLRFGNSYAALAEAARVACDMGPRAQDSRRSVLKGAMRTLDMALAKYQKDMADQQPACPEVHIDDPHIHVRIPPLPPPYNTAEQQQLEGEQQRQHQHQELQRERQQQQWDVQREREQARADMGSQAHSGRRGGSTGDDEMFAGDATVRLEGLSAGLKPLDDGGGDKSSGWGTSNISRPTNLAVHQIAARMEQQRARSGLFWGTPAGEEDDHLDF